MMFKIKTGDRSPAIAEVLYDATDTVIDLTGCTIDFHMTRQDTGELVVSAAAATFTTTVDGDSVLAAKYLWLEGDTDIAAEYWYEWDVTLPSGLHVTVPNDRPGNFVLITQALG